MKLEYNKGIFWVFLQFCIVYKDEYAIIIHILYVKREDSGIKVINFEIVKYSL